jgi:glycosyltransferase involved in cell wall biosynthesis
MKVFFVIDSLTNAGTEKSLLDIISNFSSSINCKVLYIHKPETLLQQYIDAGIKIQKISNSSSFFRNLISLKKIIKTEQPNIVVSSLYKSNILCRMVCLQTKTKLVGTFVSDSYSRVRIKSYYRKQKIGQLLYKTLDRITSFIPKYYISNSSSIKLSNCKVLNIKEEKVKVVYRGRDIEKVSEWINPENEAFTFIIIARVLQTKGYSELIDAFNNVYKKEKNVQLHIYGDGGYINELKTKIEKFDLTQNVYLKGNVVDAYQYLLKANCFVFPSWYEGLSGALIEAAISGIPIIASNISMNEEIVTGLPTALIHKVQSTESLVECMFEMIKNYDSFKQHSQSARIKAISKFDIRDIAAEYEDFLFSI